MSMYHGISVEPSLAFSMDSMCIGVILISILGVCGVAKGNRRMMKLVRICEKGVIRELYHNQGTFQIN